MAEVYSVSKVSTINYEGVLDVPEFYMAVDNWFKEKGYDKFEVKNEEIVEKEGKYVELLLEPWKKLTDYSKSVIRVHARMYNIKDVTVEVDGHQRKLNSGRLVIQTQGFMVTDYENRWDTYPFYFFIRTIFDKFFFSIYTKKYSGVIKEHTKELRAHIKSFLNLYRFKIEK